MLLITGKERQKSIQKFNEQQSELKRERSYIPLEIDDTTDTTSHEWLLYCLALRLINKPTTKERKSEIDRLKKKKPILIDEVIPILNELECKYFSK